MDVSSIPMIEFVLNQAGQGVEFRDVSAENPQFVHLREDGEDPPRLGKDRSECGGGVLRSEDVRHQGERLADQLG